jgi:hypothetical protein
MKTFKFFIIALFFLAACSEKKESSTEVIEADIATVTGAWEITNVELKSPDTITSSKPFKSIYLFTDKHYSIEIAWEDRKSWPVLEEDEERNPDDIMNAYSHLTSNSGAYEIKGDSIVFDVIVAKSPNFMNDYPTMARSHKLEGDKLLLQVTSGNGEVTQVMTLERIK